MSKRNSGEMETGPLRPSPAVHRFVDALSESLLEDWTIRLKSGERGREAQQLARRIIVDFILRASFNMPQSPSTLGWLADALDEILDFRDPREALALPKRPKHRPAGEGINRAVDVACWVQLALGRGYSDSEAHVLAAQLFACDPRSVLRMRELAADWVTGMNATADWDEYFVLIRRPLPNSRQTDTKS